MSPTRKRDPARERVADRLHSLAIHLLRDVAKADEASGLTGPRLSVLSVLVFGGGPLSLGALAAAEHVRPPTMTRLVQAMETDGLVTRATSPDDARVVLIRATKAGERVLQSARRRRLARLDALLETLRPNEVAAVERAVGLLEPLLRRPRQG